MKIINIQPLAKILATLMVKRDSRKTGDNKAGKQNSNFNIKDSITKQVETTKSHANNNLPEQQKIDNYYTQNYTIIPVPFKTTLFDKAQFYYRKPTLKETKPAEATGTLLIKLETLYLGRLWISINSYNDKLLVEFYNNQKVTIELISKTSPLLKKELSITGFKNVCFKYNFCNEAWFYNNILKDFSQENINLINFQI